MWVALCHTGDGASGEALAGATATANEVPGEGLNGSAGAAAKGVAKKFIAPNKPEPQVPPFKVALLVLLFACECLWPCSLYHAQDRLQGMLSDLQIAL